MANPIKTGNERWLDPTKLELHPMALALPLKTDDQIAALIESMEEHSFQKECPVALWEGKVIDGRHRVMAAIATGEEVYCRDILGTIEDAKNYWYMFNMILSSCTKEQAQEARLKINQIIDKEKMTCTK